MSWQCEAVPTRCGDVQPEGWTGAGVGVGEGTGVGFGVGVGVEDGLAVGSAGGVSTGVGAAESIGPGTVDAFRVALAVAVTLAPACVDGVWAAPQAVRMSAIVAVAAMSLCWLVALRSMLGPLVRQSAAEMCRLRCSGP